MAFWFKADVIFGLAGSDEDTKRLIPWTVASEALFTGKRNAAVRGFA